MINHNNKYSREEIKQKVRAFFHSTAFSNIIAIMSFIAAVYFGMKANSAIQQVNEIQEIIDNLNITSYSQTAQNAQTINNNGSNYDDIKAISNDEFSDKMDRLYETFDIIQKVSDNPNLHFSLVWYGTQEELDNTDKSTFPPHVEFFITSE